MLIIAFCVMYVDRFTITISGQYLSLVDDRNTPTTRLSASPLLKASDTQYFDIPSDIDEGLGSKNTNSYFAYSFYLIGGNDLKSVRDYSMTMSLANATNGIDDAVRIMIIKDGIRTIYAKENEDGSARQIKYGENHEDTPQIIQDTTKFRTDLNDIIIGEYFRISPTEEQKFTVVMWLDGWDTDNSMKGGTFSTELKFQIIYNEVS